jgi:hypothetical protein
MNSAGSQGMTCRIPAGQRVWHGWLIMTTLRHSRLLATLRLVVASLLVLHGSMSAVAMAKMDAGRLSQPAPLELVICTGDGLKTIKLPADGHKPAHENCECECGSLCTSKTPAAGAADTTALPAPALPAAIGLAGVVCNRFAGPDRRGDPCAPRAPPASA